MILEQFRLKNQNFALFGRKILKFIAAVGPMPSTDLSTNQPLQPPPAVKKIISWRKICITQMYL